MSTLAVLFAIGLAAASGVPALALPRGSVLGDRVAVAMMSLAGIVGIAAVLASRGSGEIVAMDWPVPGGAVGIDALSAVFLLPIFGISALGSVYGASYWPASAHPEEAGKLRLFYGLVAAGMALLVVARTSIVFLLGWEVMAIAAFVLVTTEDREPEVRDAGLVYILATHVGTLLLFGAFALLRSMVGSFELPAAGSLAASAPHAGAVFAMAAFGCAMKAGLVPLHFWLPGAHAATPSHVSALMSGVLIKMGVYGLVRFASFFSAPPLSWGAALLALGATSAIVGVVLALAQHDLKRLLAYHSVENIGIIAMGLGAALVGRSLGRPHLVALGLGACLLHVWNHALFKSLLFFAGGAVAHAAHTREIDHLGGLARRMPRTALAFLVGAVAIAGLPPLNGFASELLLYLGLLDLTLVPARGTWLAGAFALPALALVGALALACFAKVYGAVFLGEPRSARAASATECGSSMLAPMGVLAAACALLGLFPLAVAPLLDRAAAAFTDAGASAAPPLGRAAPLFELGVASAALLLCTGLVGLALRARLGREPRAVTVTWDCGYAAPSPRMQYTASSFAQLLVRLFAWVIYPVVERPVLAGAFPATAAFATSVPDLVLDRALRPGFSVSARALGWFRWMQRGNVQVYLVYVLLTLVLLLIHGVRS